MTDEERDRELGKAVRVLAEQSSRGGGVHLFPAGVDLPAEVWLDRDERPRLKAKAATLDEAVLAAVRAAGEEGRG